MEITEAIRKYGEAKGGKLDKYFDGLQLVTISIKKTSAQHSSDYEAELVLDVEHHKDFVSHAIGADPYAAIDVVVEKGERQLREFKEQLKSHH